MRAVVQRVKTAKVVVDDKVVGEIGKGVLIFLGVGEGDDHDDADYLASKIVHLRIFEDDEGKMNLSLLETGGEALIVSQFTLWGDCKKGRRPSFIKAADPTVAHNLYKKFIALIKGHGVRAAEGIFREMMDVHLVNDGPVTLLLDSEKNF
jgi:D-tyrosyl-tRNA(Tyr) deacylase